MMICQIVIELQCLQHFNLLTLCTSKQIRQQNDVKFYVPVPNKLIEDFTPSNITYKHIVQ